ncbi:holo-[acyl-carrier-protein] synthase [PVC group bacterium (ex Bugula neritina AB1)]|nr:holo-[acyl-carrier-protein] synthase [PVC group bacterium (ex Bugula neritina AB1)]
MILGIGIDIVEIERIQSAIDRFQERFFDRILTSSEKRYCLSKANPSQHLAVRFAAKEAFVKALKDCRRVSWLDIEVCRLSEGSPFFSWNQKVGGVLKNKGVQICHLSLSHSRIHAVASVVFE